MSIRLDPGGTQRVGAKIGLDGSFLGIPLSVEEVVTEREPPRLKTWATVGEPRLWVIGRYRMGFVVTPQSGASMLKVFIEYDPPASPAAKLPGLLLGRAYAIWCTRRMAADASRYFRERQQAASSSS